MVKILGFGVNKAEVPNEQSVPQKAYTGNSPLKQLEKDTVSFSGGRTSCIKPAKNADAVLERAYDAASALLKKVQGGNHHPTVRVSAEPITVKPKKSDSKALLKGISPDQIGTPVPKSLVQDMKPDDIINGFFCAAD
jgi:hypothetical protein